MRTYSPANQVIHELNLNSPRNRLLAVMNIWAALFRIKMWNWEWKYIKYKNMKSGRICVGRWEVSWRVGVGSRLSYIIYMCEGFKELNQKMNKLTLLRVRPRVRGQMTKWDDSIHPTPSPELWVRSFSTTHGNFIESQNFDWGDHTANLSLSINCLTGSYQINLTLGYSQTRLSALWATLYQNSELLPESLHPH